VVGLEEGEIGVRARRAEIRGRERVRETVRVGLRGAFGARDTLGIVGNGRGRMVKAKRAEGRRVETEDTGSAEETIDGSESDMVEEKDPLVGPTIATF
jgi:hypothetical protein